MGLDGISPNQLRITQENNSAELNSSIIYPVKNNPDVIDGLTSGAKVKNKKDREHGNQNFNKNNKREDDTEERQEEKTPVIKYDLSQTDKYSIKVSEDTNTLEIVEVKTNKIIQTLDPETLSDFVYHLIDAKGSMVNTKY